MFDDTPDLSMEWRAPRREGHVSTQALVARWEAHAKRMPDTIAIQAVDETHPTWTWRQLAQEAHLLAAHMKGAGVDTGARVALMGPACPQWVAAVWAAWICEAAWCPLPETIPALRRDEMMRQLDPQATWTIHGVQGHGSAREKCPEGSAYIIYTSGSTGKPKGVLVSSDGLLQLWQSQIALFDTTQASRVAWMLSPAFDASISDVGVALTAGATLLPIPQGRWLRFNRWQQDMDHYAIDQVDAPPSWLALWADRDPPASLRTIIAGGEPTPESILRAWSTRLLWVNVYGPTEASVCTSAQVRRVEDGEFVPRSLGDPLPGISYRIVPKDAVSAAPFLGGEECLEGELWIGGRAVALGYWKDPILTAERFVDCGGTRWFRTGDAVRKTDKEWIFLGRLDRQVKLRGQLLHLDETESVLSSMPGVAACVAMVDAHDRLVVAVAQTAPPTPDLRQWAAQRLPAWGVPQHFVRVQQWPLTATGKIDRREVAARLLGKSLEEHA